MPESSSIGLPVSSSLVDIVKRTEDSGEMILIGGLVFKCNNLSVITTLWGQS